MAGMMYLGNQKVTPVIVQGGGGYSELPLYQVVNGVPQKAAFELKGTEFSDITEVPANFFKEYFKDFTGLTGVVDFSNLTTIGQEGLSGAFQGCTGLTGVDFSSLTTVGKWGLNNTFEGCTGLTGNIDLSSITTIEGFNETFKGCTGIKNVDLSSWTGNDTGYAYAVGMFSGCTNLESVDLSSLKRIEGDFAFEKTFNGCSKLKSISLSSLKNIDGTDGFSDTFIGCISLENIEFPELETLTNSNYCFEYTFKNCTNLKTCRFTSLKTIDDECFADTFYGCIGLENIYFNSLKANLCYDSCIYGVLSGTSGVTIHFPSNQQSDVENFDGYPNFDGTNVTLAFDLPPTA